MGTDRGLRSRGILWRAPTKRKAALICFDSICLQCGEHGRASDEVVVCRIRLPAAHTRAPSRDEDLKVLQCCILRGLDLNICLLALLKYLTGRKCRGCSWCGGRALLSTDSRNWGYTTSVMWVSWVITRFSPVSRSLAAPAAACVAFHLNHNRTCWVASDDSQMTSYDSWKKVQFDSGLYSYCTKNWISCQTQLIVDEKMMKNLFWRMGHSNWSVSLASIPGLVIVLKVSQSHHFVHFGVDTGCLH